MEKYIYITAESMDKLLRCAIKDQSEFREFIENLYTVCEDMLFVHKSCLRKAEDSDFCAKGVARNLITFTMFFREHWELIHELLASLDYKAMTQEQRNEHLKQFPQSQL